MPTLTEYLETPEAYALETVIAEHPQYISLLIDYLTVAQNPLLCNERECYLYPSKVADILAVGMAYRLLVEKEHKGQDQVQYPFLEQLFGSIRKERADSTLLGYCSKVLIALVRKTPEIYEFIKDNQQLLVDILGNDEKLEYLRQFIALLLTQSTMELYVFLKSMLVRSLIFRMVEDESVGVPVYRSIAFLYKKTTKALEQATQDEKPELSQICRLFEEEHFLTLLILKLDSANSPRNRSIVEFLELACARSPQVAEVVALHVDSILDFLEEYEESQGFMEEIGKEHVGVLSVLVELVGQEKVGEEVLAQLIKRLLVYSNVHQNNSLVHNLLFKVIGASHRQGKAQLLNSLSIAQFFVKNTTEQKYGFMALRRRVFRFWVDNGLDEGLGAEERERMREEQRRLREKVEKSTHYKDWVVGAASSDLGSTKIAAQLTSPSSRPQPEPVSSPSEAPESDN